MDNQRPTILALRTTGPDGRPYHHDARLTGFAWPVGDNAVGQRVEAPDWAPDAVCGGGLHGLLWGEGGAGYLITKSDAVWQVVEAEACDVVNLGDKIKFRACIIRYSGSRAGASEYLWHRVPAGTRIARAALTGGDSSTLTGGDRSTLTGGDSSTLTGGDRSTLTGGDDSTLTGGYRSTLTGGDDSTLTGGDDSTLTWRLWDGRRYRIHTIYPGEDGIKPGTAYRAFWCDGGAVVEEVK